METQLHKKLIAESDNFSVWVEQMDESSAYLHATVTRFSPQVLRVGYRIFAEIERQAKDAGLKKLITVTPNPKFAKLFGGITVQTLSYNGIEYEVVVWDLILSQLA